MVRLLVKVKPYFLASATKVLSPLAPVGRFFLSAVVVPMYRVGYIVNKQFMRAYQPAKNKFMILVTNRYSVHVVVIGVTVFVGVLNLHKNDVRAETFGQQSLMYRLVTQQENLLVEEYATNGETIERTAVSYRENLAVSAFTRGVDFIGGDSAFTPILPGGSITAPTVSEGSASVAPREEIETYVVQSGDTFSTIASSFGISVNTLLWANNLTVRSTLRPGNELTILPTSGVLHAVVNGDTLSKIAKKYDAEEADILVFNKLADANDLVIGESLIVPGGEVQAPTPVRVPNTITQISQVVGGKTTSTPVATGSVQGTGSMSWPADLRLVTQYFGWNHTGVDIDCFFANDNYAADDGIVTFSGYNAGGYGNFVIIDHGNGIVTRYGHHAKLYVNAGDQVKKGQAIGLCGTTGRSTGTHLHFEVMVNGGFRNPLEYIR